MSKKVLVVGGGGHAKVVIDILKGYDDCYEIIGFTSQTSDIENILGVPYLGDDSIIPNLQIANCFIVAIGNNKTRKNIFERLIRLGLEPINAISQSSYVSPNAHIGRGIVVVAGAVINPCSTIHDNVIINTLTGIDHDCVVGAHAHIAPGSSLAGGVKVGEGAFIGMKASVIPEKTIGEWSVVGSGAVVVSDIPSAVTVVGVPAKKILEQKDELK
ncbi:acetyltransferase [Paenibacillus lautus]|uniref:acetyltransferase n=1 Tax=Paenibacillus lautus TaxID=1401 RepID=UPI003D277818